MREQPVIVIVELANRRAMLSVRAVGLMEHVERVNNIYPPGAVYASRNKYIHELDVFNARINLL